ncbi:MAG: glycoside-pentoside-hexuronide (GPH):cation symporter [Lachnospiraceae bacterium]|nr:glycoside-pentoside-hexuronide (GPH):cation symporter [Lachnospiraceae bacterium]
MKLKTREKVAYGLGAVGKDMVYAFIAGFIMFYYTDVLKISASFVGTMMMCARIFDAINDPLMGMVVEKTKGRFGKFKPWLLTGTLTNALMIYALYAVPEDLKGRTLLVYVSVTYILWGVTYTIMDIPFWSMLPAITKAGKDRENLSVIARSCAGVGYALVTALSITIINRLGRISDITFGKGGKLIDIALNDKVDQRNGYKIYAIIIAAIFILTIISTVINVKERIKVKSKEAPTIKQMFDALVTNDQALVVVVAIVVFNASLYLTQNLSLYFFKYAMGNEELYSLFGTVGGGFQILSMMLLPAFRVKHDCKSILKGSIFTAIFGYALMFTFSIFNVPAINILGIEIGTVVYLCIAAAIIFFGFGMATVLTTVFLADSVDYGEWKNDRRTESAIFSLQTFVVKFASAFSIFIAGKGLDIIKLDSNKTVQTESTLLGLKFIMIIIPVAGLLFSITFFNKKYILTEEKMTEITKELEERENTTDKEITEDNIEETVEETVEEEKDTADEQE